jgi:hypothetical protein
VDLFAILRLGLDGSFGQLARRGSALGQINGTAASGTRLRGLDNVVDRHGGL